MSEPTPNSRRIQAGLVLTVVFLLGMVSGAAVLHIGAAFVHQHRGAHRTHSAEDAINRIAKQLELTEEQMEEVHRILDASRDNVEHLYAGTHEQLLNVLTPEQRRKFEAMHPLPEHMRHMR